LLPMSVPTFVIDTGSGQIHLHRPSSPGVRGAIGLEGRFF
jgi:hypothetical protein